MSCGDRSTARPVDPVKMGAPSPGPPTDHPRSRPPESCHRLQQTRALSIFEMRSRRYGGAQATARRGHPKRQVRSDLPWRPRARSEPDPPLRPPVGRLALGRPNRVPLPGLALSPGAAVVPGRRPRRRCRGADVRMSGTSGPRGSRFEDELSGACAGLQEPVRLGSIGERERRGRGGLHVSGRHPADELVQRPDGGR